MKKIIIIPAYNEAENIETVLGELESYLDFDIVVVNDCSTDETAKICESYKRNNPRISLLNLPFNLGIGGAVQTGYIYAKRNNYDIAVQMDGDGQHDPQNLSDIVEPIIQNQADMVIGSRFIQKSGFQSTRMRKVGIGFFSRMIKVLWGDGYGGGYIRDTTSGFRAVGKRGIMLFSDYYPADYPEPETNALMMRLGYRVCEVPVTMRSRKYGRSSIGIINSAWYMIKVTIAILIDALRDSRGDVHGKH